MEYGKKHTDGSRSGGQKPDQKLTAELAEEIWHISNRPKNEFFAELRERGLIAPELDSLELVFGEAFADTRVGEIGGWNPIYKRFRQIIKERGMELRPQLTLEALEAAWTVAQYQAKGNESILPYMLTALTQQVQP